MYNSLYQIDWSDSLQAEYIKNHPESFSETKQQEEFEEFLKPYIQKSPILLYEAFLPIRDITLEDDWLEVASALRISAREQRLLGPTPSQGKHFFCQLQRLQTLLHNNTDQPEKFQANNSLFDLIEYCRRYIYQVRNNIVHGSKTLGEAYEQKQERRIQIYLTFLRCLTNLFFLVCDRHPTANCIQLFNRSIIGANIHEGKELKSSGRLARN